MPEVLEISSDEEEQDSKEGLSENYDWIREFLGMSESDEEKSDGSDDVVFIHENKPQPKSKSSSLVAVALKDVDVDGDGDGDGDEDDDDDDCVVLDGDPESVTCVDEEEENGSDELLVVGEKGQIACRDYPHARHLCAKFPFSSTPHDSHCEQCHCYVCDSLAPCLMWGSGLMSSDHCNANDKVDTWRNERNERKTFKVAGNGSLLPASTNHGTSLGAGHRQRTEILPLHNIHLPPDSLLRNQLSRPTAMHTSTFPSLNTMIQNPTAQPTRMFSLPSQLNPDVQNQVPKPTNISVYSTPTNLIPNGGTGNHVRCQQLGGSTLVRNRYQPHSIPKQWLGVRRHATHKERGSGASSLGPQFLRSHSMPDRVNSAVDTLMGMANHPGHVSSGFGNHVNPPLPQFDKYHTAGGFSNDRNRSMPNHVWSPQNNPPLYPPHPGFENQAYSQPLPQPQPSDGQDFYQSSIQCSDAPPSYAACLNPNQHVNHQIGNEIENTSGNIAQSGVVSQETYQLSNALGQSIEPLVACSRLHGAGSTNQPPNVNESGTRVAATSSIEPAPECYNPLNDFENWLLEKDRLSSDAVLLSELNIPSPDPSLSIPSPPDSAPAVDATALWW